MSATLALHNSLWRQGSVLPRELLNPGLIPNDLDEYAKLILISHDCDIVQPSYELEPYVEFLIARRASKPDGSTTNGKNPRRLQFRICIGCSEELYEISIHEKRREDRTVLERGGPDTSCQISPPNIRLIARWAAKRYYRPAFPTAFNLRMSAANKKFKRALEQYGGGASGIFFFLDSERELADTETYHVIVRVVAPRGALQDDREEQILLKLVVELQNAFVNCHGIEVEELKLESEAEFTLEDWKNSKVWDFEFLSISEESSDHVYLAGSGL